MDSGYPECDVLVQPKFDTLRPFDHQRSAWDELDRHYDDPSQHAGMLVVPTGGGKTLIAVRWALRKHLAQGGRILWLSHRRSLLRQAFSEFKKSAFLLPESKGQLRLIAVSGEDRAWSNVASGHDVVLGTIQTASLPGNRPALELMVEQAKAPGLLVIVDEAHHASAPSYQRVLKLLLESHCRLLGLTATPVRMSDSDTLRLANTFRKIVYQVDKKDLIEAEILSTPILETVQTKVEFEREFTEADYAHLRRFGELSDRVLQRIANHSARNRLIVDHFLKKKDNYGKTLIFAVDTLHVHTLVDEFKRKNVPVEWVDYTRGDSDQVIRQFREQPIPPILINVEMLTEGVDIPMTQTVFLVRPTRSDALLSQMIGRAPRGPRAGGTREAHLVTFVDTWKQFHPLDVEYVLGLGEIEEGDNQPPLPANLVPIAPELISAAYELVRSNGPR